MKYYIKHISQLNNRYYFSYFR